MTGVTSANGVRRVTTPRPINLDERQAKLARFWNERLEALSATWSTGKAGNT
jgi:hypothetical protein